MPAAKCTKKIIESVRVLIEQGLSWAKIAEVTDLERKTLYNYRDPNSDSYNKDFAEMVEEAKERFDCGEIKAGQVEQAVKHTLKKIYWEHHQVDVRSLDKKEKEKAGVLSVEKDEGRKMAKMSPPPDMPPTWMKKVYLIDYACQILDLSVGDNLSIAEIRAECLLRVKELTVTIKVKVESDQEVDPNQAAVKNVLTNTGRDEDRWSFKDEREHDVTDKLGKLLTEIGSSRSVLPKQEEIKDFDKS